jgi:hypothetical protein
MTRVLSDYLIFFGGEPFQPVALERPVIPSGDLMPFKIIRGSFLVPALVLTTGLAFAQPAASDSQTATGPSDILTITNRGISRSTNHALTEAIPLDVWMAPSLVGTQADDDALCPSGTDNANCVIDNASVRYDQSQGRFVVLFTVTDLPAHRSNWVLAASTASPLLTPPIPAGRSTTGRSSSNWTVYTIPINLQPVSTADTSIAISTDDSPSPRQSAPLCANGGSAHYTRVDGVSSRTCTNYFPTGARLEIDNDNLTLTAPVVDRASAPGERNAGTRVTTISKSVVYSGSPLNANQDASFTVTTAFVSSAGFQDVPQLGSPTSSFYTWIQLAKNVGLAVPSALGPCLSTLPGGASPPVIQPPNSGTTPSTTQLTCPYFGPDAIVSRAEMAYWVVRSQLDEPQITSYLCATGGDPSGLTCGSGILASSFGDLGVAGASIVNPFLPPNPALGIAGVTNAQLMRDIEVMVRRGYTQGCTSTNDPVFRYCPNDPVTRAQMSVFIIRHDPRAVLHRCNA